MSEHQHTWHLYGHQDGCHASSWEYGCLCGARRRSGAERDFNADAGMDTAFWFEETCSRCRELLEGAEPQQWDDITETAK